MIKRLVKKASVVALAGGLLIGVNSPTLAEEIASYESEVNVEFEENTDITNPMDPTNPDSTSPVIPQPDPNVPNQVIGEGTAGPLSIDYASHFNFGIIKKSGNGKTYEAKPITIESADGTTKEVAPYVQVTDNRGTNSGWTLSVLQEAQLVNTATDHELTGAQITIEQGTITGTTNTDGLNSEQVTLTPGEAMTIFEAENGSNGGTFVNSFGDADNVGVSLNLVSGTEIEDGAYQATINWILEDIP